MVAEDEFPPETVGSRQAPRRWGRIGLFAVLALVVGALIFAWVSRERLADRVISDQLAALNLPATYEIESIGPRYQVLKNVVVGDPAQPDLVVERVEVSVEVRWGMPGIGVVKLTRPRLYGELRQGELSFGSLDPLLFGKSDKPFRLPDLNLVIVDGRALLNADVGDVGIKIDGHGPLRGGFAGTIAAIAPSLAIAGCAATRASVYGKLSVRAEKPRFVGPVRVEALRCPAQRLGLERLALQFDARLDQPLDGTEGTVVLAAGPSELDGNRVREAQGRASFAFRKRALTARYYIGAGAIETPQAGATAVTLEGSLRSSPGFARIESEGTLRGEGLRLGTGFDASLRQAQRASGGTLAEPLLGQMRSALAQESRASSLTASFMLRRTPALLSLVVPQGAVKGTSGATLLSVSRFQLSGGGAGVPTISGNFFTGGQGLPRIAGRMERQRDRGMVLRMTMPQYRAGTASAELPSLTLAQSRDGALTFNGEARLTGALPGGRMENLLLPLSGTWSPRAGLAAWRACVTPRFDSLTIANLRIDRRAISLCPPPGQAIVQIDGRGTRIAAGASALDLSGRLGETPIRLRGGAVGFAVPGMLAARSLEVALGPATTASRFTIDRLDARIGNEVAGRFAGSEVRLHAVPLDILAASGDWRFVAGRLTLTNAAFRLEDRSADDRFRPLTAREAALTLAENVVIADALLREPASDRAVVHAAIRHDLASARGHADLAVDGLAFDEQVQPDTLTPLALGVVANARGVVRGTGRIDWNAQGVTSGGRFTTSSLDFAAAFGPVKGASGTVEFTDLLGLVTAPRQELRIASVNPGIEVNDGVLVYALLPNSVVDIAGARWPFFGGTLVLQPTRVAFGSEDLRRFTLEISALDAARFVERLELANLSATGTFDGTMPLVFDKDGGRIEGGRLQSRPDGGNVSYVGALTYKDLSAMANFAFDALKSLDYRQMDIAMDGALAGELVTRLRFFGVTQGEGAERNFLTKRIGKLPIQFNVNLRAPFFQLISSFKSMYDPEFVRDPRTLGLLDAQGRPVTPATQAAAPSTRPR